MRNAILFILWATIAGLSQACKSTNAGGSMVKDLAYNSAATNVAAFFTSPNPVGNTTVYIENDPETIIEGLTTLDEGFKTYKNEAATSSVVTSWVKTFVGPQYLSEDGTLFLYIAGHGAPTAQSLTSDGTFVDFDMLAAAIQSGRPGKPLKRLVLMVFGCFSGSWINLIHSENTAKVADQIFVITSSTSDQYSYSGGYNSELVNAFGTVLASYGDSPDGITLKRFAEDIQKNVASSTPQFYATSTDLLNQTLFSAASIARYKEALKKGVMPTPEEFSAGRRTPSKATFDAGVALTTEDPDQCKLGILKNVDGKEFCSAWNLSDKTQHKNAAAYVAARPPGSVSRCDQPLIYASLGADAFKLLFAHCKGFLKGAEAP